MCLAHTHTHTATGSTKFELRVAARPNDGNTLSACVHPPSLCGHTRADKESTPRHARANPNANSAHACAQLSCVTLSHDARRAATMICAADGRRGRRVAMGHQSAYIYIHSMLSSCAVRVHGSAHGSHGCDKQPKNDQKRRRRPRRSTRSMCVCIRLT